MRMFTEMRNRLSQVRPDLLVLTVFALMTARLFWMINIYAVDILFLDQWDFFGGLFYDHSLTELFRWQHGPHRQGLSLPLTMLVAHASGWNMRVEAFMVGIIITSASGLALWLKCRLAGPLQHSDVVIPLLFLSLGQFATFFNTPNPAHSALPLALMMGLGLAWTLRDRRARYAATLLFDFVLVYTGFGVFAGVVVPGVLLVEAIRDLRGNRPRNALLPAVCAGLASLILGSFFIDYKFAPALPNFEFPVDDWWLYPRIMATALGRFVFIPRPLGELVGFVVLAGSLVVLLMHGLWLLKRYNATAIRQVIVLMIGFGLLFLANMAVGRASIGLYAGTASRYMTLIAMIFFGLYLHSTMMDSPWRKRATGALIVCLLWSSAFVQPAYLNGIRMFTHAKTTWRDKYLETKSIAQADKAARFQIYPWPENTNLQWKLDWLEQRRLSIFAKQDRD